MIRFTAAASATAIAIALLAAPAFAADEPARPVAEDQKPAETDEVVVTAQKRTENVQDVAAKVSVVDGARLERYAIDSAVDVAKFAPNANAWNNDGRSRPRYFIRGIGNGNVSNNAVGAVSLYNDEIYLNSLVLQGFPVLDLERVEVLSGPQGTLQGKNATAGAINFLSRKPGFTTDGYAKASLGDYGQKQFEAAVGGPLSQTIAARASVRIEKQGGTATNRFNGQDAGDFRDVAARFQILANPTDTTTILANVHYRNLDATRTATYVAVQAQRAPLVFGDRDFTNTNIDSPQKVDAGGGFVRIDQGLPAGLTLTSITGYERGDRTEIADGDNSARELSRSYSRTRPDQFTQEVRLTSPAEGAFSWILGGYYFHERLRSFAATGALTAATGGTPSYFYTRFTQKTDSYAAFGNVRFDPFEVLHLQGGLRWTKDRSDIDIVSQRAVPPVAYANTDSWWLPSATGQALVDIARLRQRADWSKLTYDASARLDVTRAVRLYGRIANGYRAGNFQGQVAPTTPPGIVDPETLTAYEAGLKTDWFDGRLTFNVDAFYSDYKDIQISVVRPAPTGIAASLANAAGGYSRGIEAELRARPVPGLNIVGNLGLLKTKFTSFTVTNATVNLDGAEFARAPRKTGFVAVDYTIPFSAGSVTLGTDWRYNSHFFFLVTDETSPALQQDGYAVGNVRVSYRTRGDRFEVTAGVYNVADTAYKVQVLPYSFASYGYALGAPRTFLTSVKTSF